MGHLHEQPEETVMRLYVVARRQLLYYISIFYREKQGEHLLPRPAVTRDGTFLRVNKLECALIYSVMSFCCWICEVPSMSLFLELLF